MTGRYRSAWTWTEDCSIASGAACKAACGASPNRSEKTPRPRSNDGLRNRRRAAQKAYREGQRAAQWEDWNACADFIRRSHHAVRQARKITTALGPQHPRTWPTLELAARVEGFALAVEAELDDILASGRVA
jgi:hypothetical protein